MWSIWFYGFLAVIVYRVFAAGMNSKNFYRVSPYRIDNGKIVVDEGAVFTYAWLTLVYAVTWMVSLPAFGIFLLGKRFAKGFGR